MSAAVEVKIDPGLKKAATEFLASSGPWWALAVIFILMLPKLIPAISAAVAEQRKISHKRQDNLRKIQNNAARRNAPPSGSGRSGRP